MGRCPRLPPQAQPAAPWSGGLGSRGWALGVLVGGSRGGCWVLRVPEGVSKWVLGPRDTSGRRLSLSGCWVLGVLGGGSPAPPTGSRAPAATLGHMGLQSLLPHGGQGDSPGSDQAAEGGAVTSFPMGFQVGGDWSRRMGRSRGGRVPTLGGTAALPSTHLLLKRREVAEVERELQSRRECPHPGHWHGAMPSRPAVPQEFRQRMERLEQRRQHLRQRKDQLRDVVLKFDTFLKAAAARRERAQRRADRVRVAGQGAKATRLRRELEGLLQRRERLARRLRSLRCFGDYLQGVLASSGQFQDVPAMLAHFGGLAGVRVALVQRAEAGQEQLAQGWARLRRYQEEADTELRHATAELTQLRAQLQAARRDVLQEESRWAHVQGAATQKMLLLGQIKLAVLHLFQLATARLEAPTAVGLGDTEAQLDTAPIPTGAAPHAGPGCHLRRAAPQGDGAAAPTPTCGPQHTAPAPRGGQGGFESGIAPREASPMEIQPTADPQHSLVLGLRLAGGQGGRNYPTWDACTKHEGVRMQSQPSV
ncbi:cilia- and flagella-associated protein 73 [Rhynochetos jubatus]